MLKSMFDAQFHAPSEANKSLIGSMNLGLLMSNSLSCLKFPTVCMLTLSFFGTKTMGNAHSTASASSSNSFLSVPVLTCLSNSFFASTCYGRGTGYSLAMYGLAPGFNFSVTGLPHHSPCFPWNSCLYLLSSPSTLLHCSSVKCLYFSPWTSCSRSGALYLLAANTIPWYLNFSFFFFCPTLTICLPTLLQNASILFCCQNPRLTMSKLMPDHLTKSFSRSMYISSWRKSAIPKMIW
mmetsp:Transcript_5670/g.8318  ORF Transcript_5670/g.8318 Transcript_5670/m.8318 type:complete len:237 (-) Transcript_5670:1198-1908(-)